MSPLYRSTDPRIPDCPGVLSTSRFECDICGRLRKGVATICLYCHNAVCERCMHSQAGRGHMDAEHRHEMAESAGEYVRDDE